MEIRVYGDSALEQAADLTAWIRKERISGLTVEQRRGPTIPGTQGAEWLPVVAAILSAPAITAVGTELAKSLITAVGTELAKSLYVWFRTRGGKNVDLEFTLPDGKSLKIHGQNIGGEQALVSNLISLLQPSPK